MCVCFIYLHVCMCTTHVPGAHGCQERVTDTLELELKMTVSFCVDAGSQTWVPLQAQPVFLTSEVSL